MRYYGNPKDYIQSRLQEALDKAHNEALDELAKKDPILQRYDSLGAEIRRRHSMLEKKQADELSDLKRELRPLEEEREKLLGVRDSYEPRRAYIEKHFKAVFEKTKQRQQEMEEALILLGKKDLLVFMNNWLKKLGSK